MRAFFATVLSAIAVGVLLIAYGLLSPRPAGAPYAPYGAEIRDEGYRFARPTPAGDLVSLRDQAALARLDGTSAALAFPVNNPPPVRAVLTQSAPSRSTVRVRRSPGRDWGKMALVIGGSTAAGAGVGAMFGGKKGALIGAALGGGGSTIFEAVKH